MFQHIEIILCETSHPGNIGAAARAMKNMGLTQLTLVSPRHFPHPEAIHRSSGADDVLAKAKVVSSLSEAVASCQWLYGTSARDREFPWPQLTPAQAAQTIKQYATSHKIGVLFGNEQTGLSNEALQLCDYHICIPTNPEFASLNLGAAVQVISYEVFQALSVNDNSPPKKLNKATQQEIVGLVNHFEQIAIEVAFLDPKHPKKLMTRIKKLLTKTQLEKEEINILRGFLKAIEVKTKRVD